MQNLIKTFILISYTLLMIACTTKSTKKNKPQKDNFISEKIEQNNNEDGLNKFFKKETIQLIINNKTQFKSIKNSTELIKNLYEASNLAKKLTNEITTSTTDFLNEKRQKFEYSELTNELLKELNFYKDELQPIAALEGPEASSVDFFVDFRKYNSFTNSTQNKDDDEFIKLIIEIYGEQSLMGYLNFTEEWILRESQELNYFAFGNNKLLEVFQQIRDYESNYSNSFKNEIGKLKDKVINNLVNMWENEWVCYYQKELVINEFNEITKLDNLSPKFKTQLTKHIEWLEKQDWTYFGNDPEERQSYDVGEQ